MNLIKMTDFVLEQGNPSNTDSQFADKVMFYANFLKQPLKLEMFVPCDDEGNIITLPNACICTDLCRLCKKYQQAKEKVLFEGIPFEEAYYILSQRENKAIEDLARFNITLTKSAIKKLGL